MNMRLLAEALNVNEMNELANHIHYIMAREARLIALKTDFLNQDEKDMVDSGKYIDAIKSVRSREGLSLFEAKVIVDVYREKKQNK